MSLLNRDRYRKKLHDLLSIADDEAFVKLVWAVDALQSGRASAAALHIQFPAEAVTADIASQFKIHRWELETLIGRLLVTPKMGTREGVNRVVDCTKFAACANATNFLRKLEDAEAGIFLKKIGALNEMHRVAQRQFPWERGYFNVAQFYRYAYIYGQGDCARYFQGTYDLTVNEFSLIGFGLNAGFQGRPWLQRSFSLEKTGISSRTFEAGLRLLSITLAQARERASSMIRQANNKHGAPLPVAYQPSFLRHVPIIAFGEAGERMFAPLPQLILLRTTAGVYYDLVNGPTNLRNEASLRFEEYSAAYIAAMMPGLNVGRSHKYKVQGNTLDTPDILVRKQEEIAIVIECKATKLSFAAQFSDDPLTEARVGYEEIAKGVFQLWRYFSHARRGAVDDVVRPDAHGMVLTLDTWLAMSRELQMQVLASAAALATRDNEITEEDRRNVVFCSIEDLEATLATSNEDSLLRAMSAARDGAFAGWVLPAIHRETEGKAQERKPFPFDLGNVLPWWNEVRE